MFVYCRNVYQRKMEDKQQAPPMETDCEPQVMEDCNGEAEKEKTLTDHLNKKLLESFLQRVDQGEFEQFMSGSDANKGDSKDEEWRNETNET